MLTLRLDKNIEDDLCKIAKLKGLTKSELVRRSIIEYVSCNSESKSWKVGEPIFGKYSSGKGNLAEDSETLLRKKFDKRCRH
jgi:predicted transcriptional regulator